MANVAPRPKDFQACVRNRPTNTQTHAADGAADSIPASDDGEVEAGERGSGRPHHESERGDHGERGERHARTDAVKTAPRYGRRRR